MNTSSLRTEYAVNPLGLGVASPRLFWQLESERSGALQVAYRLVVASTRDALGAADLWDSGRVESNRTTHVEYAGKPLSSRQAAFWQVEVEDETGVKTRSDVASFEVGLLDPTDWQGQWIGGQLVGAPNAPVPTPFLRTAFGLDKPVKSARLYATALGIYECELNGQRVGNQVFAPGWTDYSQRVQYQTYDATALLQNGENAWGAVLGDGWYSGRVGWQGRQNYGDKPAFLGQLEIEFEDGTRQTVVTGEEWKYSYGPIAASDLLMGETYDARREFDGWSESGFDAQKWVPVEVTKAPEIKISAPLGPPVTKAQEVAAINLQDNGIFDFGQNLVGRVRLKVSGPRGTTIRLRFAETLKDGPKATTGPLYIENLRSAAQTDYYTLKGEGEEVWEPRFTFHGFRFVEVSGWPGKPALDGLTALVYHSDTPKTGDFVCSDPLLNQLQKNIDWGQRGNFLDIPTDCPQRDERLGWTGDAQVFVRTAAFNRNVAGFFTEWARDTADAQTAQGSVPCVIPTGQVFVSDPAKDKASPGYDGGPAWADAVLICPWTIYRCYGDVRILQENYPVFEKFLSYQQQTSQDFMRCNHGAPYFRGFGDWLALDGSGKVDGGTPKELIGTAFLAHDADLMSQIAAVLGKAEDAARYRKLFKETATVFNSHFVTPKGLVFPGTQTAFLLALHFDLLPEALRQNAADALALDIKNRGYKLTTGFVGSPYINHVLTRFGHLDTAYHLLHQTAWPSWLYAVTQGATTIWERWNGWTHDQGFESIGMNSFNHYAYGAIGDWLYAVVAGIELDPTVSGYGRFVLAPQPGGQLTSARAYLDALHGRIESDWKVADGVFEWEFTVPANTTAQVVAPNGEKFEAVAGKHHFKAEIKI